jgi:Uma2 family endonuclease
MRRELIREVMAKDTPPGDDHGRLVIRIGNLFHTYCEGTDNGEVRGGDSGFLLGRNPDTVRCPNVAWKAPGHLEGTVVG